MLASHKTVLRSNLQFVIMHTLVLSRCRVFFIKTHGIMSRCNKSRACLSALNCMPAFQQNRTGSARLLQQINEFSSDCRNNQLRNTLYITRPTSKLIDSIMKQRNEHFTVGRVMYKPLDDMDVKKAINVLTDKFMEARELLSDARESEGTVYFSEDMEEAQQAVKDTLDEYSDLLSKLSEQQRQDVLRTIGLKMEELKAQLQALIEELKEEH